MQINRLCGSWISRDNLLLTNISAKNSFCNRLPFKQNPDLGSQNKHIVRLFSNQPYLKNMADNRLLKIPSYSIRVATANDSESISKIHINCWIETYRGIVPDESLKKICHKKRHEAWLNTLSSNSRNEIYYIAEDYEKNIIGFSAGGLDRSEMKKDKGELHALYISKVYQGKGIGKRLFLEVVEWLISNNYKSMLVWVLHNNPYRGFYQHLGGQLLERKKEEVFYQSKLLQEAYQWDDLPRLSQNLKSVSSK
ncbi:MAG: GCN5-related N-acetyltransferase [Chlamydiales bacterium]|jgi:GNAT superfamily N-acetyltransferase|nr:GCN5-related N-acetyltransferase [Chlamydiales bacterium]